MNHPKLDKRNFLEQSHGRTASRLELLGLHSRSKSRGLFPRLKVALESLFADHGRGSGIGCSGGKGEDQGQDPWISMPQDYCALNTFTKLVELFLAAINSSNVSNLRSLIHEHISRSHMGASLHHAFIFLIPIQRCANHPTRHLELLSVELDRQAVLVPRRAYQQDGCDVDHSTDMHLRVHGGHGISHRHQRPPKLITQSTVS